MASIKFTNECVLEINPIFEKEKEFVFVECNIKESILGEIPRLTLIVATDKDLCKLNDKITGSLTNEKGNKTYFKGYVLKVDFTLNKGIIEILCTDFDFLRKEQTNKFTSMNNAIKALYPGTITSNTQSDLMNSMEIYQKDMTNYNIIKKCLLGYKKNTIYGFALGGLRINDLNNWKPEMDVSSLVNIQPVDTSKYTDPKLYHMDTKFIDYSNGKDPNHQLVKFYDRYIPVNKEYEDFVANIQYNSRFKTMKNTTNYNTRELLYLNISDSVEVKDKYKEIKKCFVSSRTICFNSNDMQVDYTIQSIDPL